MKMKLLSLIFLGTLMLFSVAAVNEPEAPVGLPTRPVPTPPTSTPLAPTSEASFSGGQIVLRAAEGDATAGLWTAMQWQDPNTAEWYNVDGWRGHFDTAGQVIWWVGAEDLNSGPFRWQVYSDETETNLLLTSESFMQPTHSGERVTVEIDLP